MVCAASVAMANGWREGKTKMEFKGSKTEANLMAAFAGESQARNKYDSVASNAKKER